MLFLHREMKIYVQKQTEMREKKEEEYVIYLSVQSNRKNCWRKKKLASTVIPFVCIGLSIIVFRLV